MEQTLCQAYGPKSKHQHCLLQFRMWNPGSYRCWLNFLESVSLLPSPWPNHLGGGHLAYLAQWLPGDLRGHSLPISTSLVSARAKSGPVLLGAPLSCGSHSPALASQAKRAGSREVLGAAGHREVYHVSGQDLPLFKKRVWGSEPANTVSPFSREPSHTLHANSMCLWHLICVEIPGQQDCRP